MQLIRSFSGIWSDRYKKDLVHSFNMDASYIFIFSQLQDNFIDM